MVREEEEEEHAQQQQQHGSNAAHAEQQRQQQQHLVHKDLQVAPLLLAQRLERKELVAGAAFKRDGVCGGGRVESGHACFAEHS